MTDTNKALEEITPQQARNYIETFSKHVFKGMEYVDFPSGRIYLNDMTDAQAIKVAYGLMYIEDQATKGARKQ
jgi:hypothetical protein